MRRIILLLCCSIALLAQAQAPKKKPVPAQPASPKPGPAQTKAINAPAPAPDIKNKVLPYTIHQKKMANGLNVVTIPFESPGVAAFYIVVRVGSRDEIEPGKTGFAHFFEHMMFRGTKKYPKEAYSEALKMTGASANANTSLDRTVYHMTGDASKLEKMFELEADRFMNLSYSEQDFRTEAGAVKGEYTKNSSSPYTRLNEKLQETAFDQHTYKHTTMGFLKDIVDMPNQFAYSRQFFQRYYRPEYTTILVVGDVTPAGVEALSQRYFGTWQRGTHVNKIPSEPAQKGTRYAHIQKSGFPPYLSLNFRGPGYSDSQKDVAALNILGSALFGENSPLYEKLVINEQKCREIDGGIFPTRDPFLFSADASLVNAADMKYVQEQINLALAGAKEAPMDPARIDQARQNIRNSFARRIDNPTSVADAVSDFIGLTGDRESCTLQVGQDGRASPCDGERDAQQYCVSEQCTIGTISPSEKSDLQ